MSRRLRIAVLGAGITGSTTALLLARAGHDVDLFDQAGTPMAGASRWNEGKIHLGFLYAADPTGRTAERVLDGGLAFRRLVEALIGTSLNPSTTDHDDTYVIHRRSVVDAESVAAYFDLLCRRVAGHPDAADYLVDLRRARTRRLSQAELSRDYDGDLVTAGFRVPERSVSTCWVADRICELVVTQPRICFVPRTRVLAVAPSDRDGPFRLRTAIGDFDGYDWCVNATWEGRPRLDRPLGIEPPAPWTHRFRLSVFVQMGAPVDIPSTVVAAGPFGDVKNYDGRNLYLSWYPEGLVATGTALDPPDLPARSIAADAATVERTVAGLAEAVPAAGSLLYGATDVRAEGGWVYAVGTGSLDDATATLHRRDQVGIHAAGRYLSVDTGKYSIGPALAHAVCERILSG